MAPGSARPTGGANAKRAKREGEAQSDEIPPLVALREIIVRAAGREVLAVEALRLARGQSVSIVGPTGAGKSTLLRVLAGIEQPAGGEVQWRGEPLAWPWPLSIRRRVTMAFQAPHLFRGTVRDNVAYGLRVRGQSRVESRRAVDEILERFGIGGLASRPANELSGGEAQRVSLARAIVVRPELLLLDEPFASLDQQTRERLRNEVRAMTRSLGIGSVYVTHDQAEARLMGERLGVIAEGELLQLGPADDVYERPASLPVARLLGVQNLWQGILVESEAEGGAAVVVLVDGTHCRARRRCSAAAGAEVTVCVRAEDITLEPADSASGDEPDRHHTNVTVGEVASLSSIGPLCEVTLGSALRVVAQLTRRQAKDLQVAVGQRLRARIPEDAVHLLPPAP